MDHRAMNTPTNPYVGHRYPPEIISHAVWLYHRFCLSFRDVEDLLAERGVIVSYETIRQWCLKFGKVFARTLRRWQGRLGDTWFMDEVFITIGGWVRQRAVRASTLLPRTEDLVPAVQPSLDVRRVPSREASSQGPSGKHGEGFVARHVGDEPP